MTLASVNHLIPASRWFATAAVVLALSGCTVGPDYEKPQIAAPGDWTEMHSGNVSLHSPVRGAAPLSPTWWKVWADPVLDDLEARALAANPDLASAALHFAAARVEREGADAAGLPQLNLKSSVSRQKMSEYGASTRLFDVIGSGTQRDEMAKFLANPFTLFQGGFDAGWEPDLWGKVRRSIEAADAQVAGQGATLDLTRLSVASEVARTYFQLRTVQRQLELAEEEIGILEQRESIVDERVKGGLDNHTAIEAERASTQGLKSGLPTLRAREAALLNALALLTADRPGSLQALLSDANGSSGRMEPDLSLGLPSQVALARPDVRAAEAALHAATARIGVAVADLYPSIRLGGGFNLESYKSENLFDWGSRTWSIGPSLDLPIFDGGRRRSVVAIRKIEQREAAVRFQKTVLTAWQEIDDALNGYSAERMRWTNLMERLASTQRRHDLLMAQYEAGNINYLPVLDAKRAVLQGQRDLAESEGNLRTRYIAINKSVGNVPPPVGAEANAITSK